VLDTSQVWHEQWQRGQQVDAENPAMTLQLTIDIAWRRVSDPTSEVGRATYFLVFR
jgi:hypothetical protein